MIVKKKKTTVYGIWMKLTELLTEVLDVARIIWGGCIHYVSSAPSVLVVLGWGCLCATYLVVFVLQCVFFKAKLKILVRWFCNKNCNYCFYFCRGT